MIRTAADFEEIIHVMRSGGKAYVKWSLALDQNHGPNAGGCNTCNPLVTVNSSSGAVSYTIDFYTLGHFSKFVLPGAHRIYSGNAVRGGQRRVPEPGWFKGPGRFQ